MINWRSGKAAFVGASKYLIKGVFSFSRSLTSAAPAPPTPDCFIGFEGPIDVDDTILGFEGPITDTIGFIGVINDDPLGFIGPITDIIGFEGEICD